MEKADDLDIAPKDCARFLSQGMRILLIYFNPKISKSDNLLNLNYHLGNLRKRIDVLPNDHNVKKAIAGALFKENIGNTFGHLAVVYASLNFILNCDDKMPEKAPEANVTPSQNKDPYSTLSKEDIKSTLEGLSKTLKYFKNCIDEVPKPWPQPQKGLDTFGKSPAIQNSAANILGSALARKICSRTGKNTLETVKNARGETSMPIDYHYAYYAYKALEMLGVSISQSKEEGRMTR